MRGETVSSSLHVSEVASPCRQGATFPGAVLPAAVDSSGTVRVAGVASLQRCVAACCDSPGCDSAWLSKGRCYASSCQRGASCRPQASPGADSVSAFLQRAPPRSSSEWGEPYDGQEGGATESGRSQDTFNQSQREGPGGAEPGSNMTQNRRWSDGTEETAGTRKPEARPSATGSAPTNHTMMMSSPRDDISVTETPACESSCSGRGQCDPITKQCSCDPFWTENSIRLYSGDGQSNCEWRVSYVISSSFSMMLSISSLSWTFVCCSRRRKRTKGRRKTRYTISDDMDEQERSESRPRFSSKHRSTEHNSSLMMSESESDSDSVLSRNRIGSRAARNGDAFR